MTVRTLKSTTAVAGLGILVVSAFSHVGTSATSSWFAHQRQQDGG